MDGFPYQNRILNCLSSDDNTMYSYIHILIYIFDRTDTAADLHRNMDILQDLADHCPIHGSTGVRTVQINNMEAFCPLILPPSGHFQRLGRPYVPPCYPVRQLIDTSAV